MKITFGSGVLEPRNAHCINGFQCVLGEQTYSDREEDSVVGVELGAVGSVSLMYLTVTLGLESFLFLVHLLLQSSDTSVLHGEELSRSEKVRSTVYNLISSQ